MCLIINREEGQIVTDDFIKDVATRNGDGWGIMHNRPSDNKVVVKRGLKLDEFFPVIHALQEKDIPCVIHFRMRTHGAVDVENCHPFKVVNGVYFMHNGTIDVDIPKKDSGKASDTNVFVRDVLAPLLLSVKDRELTLRSSWFEHFMDAQAKSHNSRFVLMDEEGPRFYGNWTKTTTGIWCSNTYAYTLDNPTKKTYTPVSYPKNYGYYDYMGYGDESVGASRAADSASKANALYQTDYIKNQGESTIDYYKRLGMNKDKPKFKTSGETYQEWQDRMRGAVEGLIKLPETPDEVIIKAMAEIDKQTVDAMEALVYYDNDYALEYLEFQRVRDDQKKEVGKSVIPFQSQTTQETNPLGTQTKDIQQDAESVRKNGNEHSNNDGNNLENEQVKQKQSLHEGWIDLVSQLNQHSQEVDENGDIIESLQDELEETLDNFEEVAENDWCLSEEEIATLSDKIVTGELTFKYDRFGQSTLSDSTGVLYPDFMANKEKMYNT